MAVRERQLAIAGCALAGLGCMEAVVRSGRALLGCERSVLRGTSAMLGGAKNELRPGLRAVALGLLERGVALIHLGLTRAGSLVAGERREISCVRGRVASVGGLQTLLRAQLTRGEPNIAVLAIARVRAVANDGEWTIDRVGIRSATIGCFHELTSLDSAC